MIEVDGLSFKYVGRKRPALRNVSFQVRQGESLLVLGPSGGGKSTLALCLNGAIPHFVEGDFAGSVRVGGTDTRQASMADLAQRVGIVFQDPEAQFCMLTVAEEVAFGLENLAVPRADMDERIDEALAQVGFAERRLERIERLSGGQKQRLALACVLAQRPEVLVFDEPTAQLDPLAAAEVIDLLSQLRKAGQHTLIIVEHRLDELMHLVDRVLVLDQDGEAIVDGPPREVIRHFGTWLMEAGVWIPQVSELAMLLERDGIGLRPFPLTVSEAADALRPITVSASARVTHHPHGELPESPLITQPAPIIRVRDLNHQYAHATQPSLRNVSLDLWRGEFVAIVGANGAGKTTLARHMVGILQAPAGTVFLDGQDIRHMPRGLVSRRVGYVFQYPEHQFIGMTLLDDVAFGLQRAGVPDGEADRTARAMLDDFGLGHLGAAHPYSLSHGEQRRLSVAAMLVLDQDALVLDEPTFGQDRRNSDLLLDKLASLAADGRTIVAITHDMRLVAERADRVLVMVDGALRFDGTPESLFDDADLTRHARLAPPPLVDLSYRLGLPAPLARIEDFVAHVREHGIAGRVNAP
ncbi:MAG TPA: ABC transporter ATP-binding protein [Chloroflexota bacterium]|nr:ABC transporter ATP-binding protein [Chloroflexota bacterium]